MLSKTILGLVLFCGFVASNVSAQQSFFIKAGGTYSYLKEPSYGDPGMGYLYGIGKDWRLYHWIQLRTEVLVTNSATALKNRTVQSGSDLPDVIRSFPHLPNEGTGFTDIRYFDFDPDTASRSLLLLDNVRPGDVGRHEVGGELNAFELQPERLGNGANQKGFRGAWQPGDETMPADKQRYHHLFENLLLADNYAAHLCDDFALDLLKPVDAAFQLRRIRKCQCWSGHDSVQFVLNSKSIFCAGL